MTTRFKFLCLCFVLLTGFLHAEGEIEFLDDTDSYDAWVRAKQVDTFDDTELHRQMIYFVESVDGGINTMQLRRETALPGDEIIDNKFTECQTYMTFMISTASLEQKVKQPMSSPITVSFNFKKEDKDDEKILNIPFYDRSTADMESSFFISMFSGTLKDITSKKKQRDTMKKLLTAFTESYEVRAKVNFDSSFMVDQSVNYVFNLKADLTGFQEKWEWAKRHCEDPAIDSTENDEADTDD